MVVPLALARGGVRLPRTLLPWVFLAGLLEAVAFLALATATALGPVSVAAVVTSQFATFGVILGVVFLKERPTPWQMVGVASTIGAVSLLAGVGGG